MSVLDALRNLVRPQERAITPQQLFSTGLDEWYADQSATGLQITTERAMRAAQGACVRLLADDIASLPIDTMRKVGGESLEMPKPAWLRSPSARRWDTTATFISDIVVSLGMDGNAFLACSPNVLDVERIDVLDPDTVEVREDGDFDVNRVRYSEDRIIHIPWVRLPGKLRGMDPVEVESVGLELAAREWAARFFGNGATVGGVIELPGARPSTEEVEALRKQFAMRHQGRRKSHAFGVLYGGAKYNPVTLRPQEAELMPLWRHVLEEAARIYHIPPHLLASQDPGGSSYSSVEQRSIEYVVHGVTTFTSRIERALSQLLPGAETFVRLNVNGLLRGDMKTRAEMYGIFLDKKVMRRSEVRALEDLPPDPEADAWLETPNNNPKAEPAPAASEPPERIEPVVLSQREEQPVNVTVHGAPVSPTTTVHLDRVTVDEEGLRTITSATTERVSETMATLGGEMAERSDRVAETVTDSMSRVEETVRDLAHRFADIEARQKAIEDIEARRSEPVSIDIRRDAEGRPAVVYQRQGGRVVKKRLRRDENGRVIGVVEEVA